MPAGVAHAAEERLLQLLLLLLYPSHCCSGTSPWHGSMSSVVVSALKWPPCPVASSAHEYSKQMGFS